MQLTFGGLTKSEALHWTQDTYQKFGSIIYDLTSNNPQKRLTGYQEFLNLKRHFFEQEWNSKITTLNTHRITNNHKPFETFIEDIRAELVETGSIKTAEQDVHPLPPLKLPTAPPAEPPPPTPCLNKNLSETVEQLSLF